MCLLCFDIVVNVGLIAFTRIRPSGHVFYFMSFSSGHAFTSCLLLQVFYFTSFTSCLLHQVTSFTPGQVFYFMTLLHVFTSGHVFYTRSGLLLQVFYFRSCLLLVFALQVMSLINDFRRKHLAELQALTAISGTSLGLGFIRCVCVWLWVCVGVGGCGLGVGVCGCGCG